jgi:putative effector of murein hydrolase
MNVAGALKIVGIAFIIAGVIGVFLGFATVDYDSYKQAKDISEELYDNEFAEASYNTAKSLYLSELSIVITSVIGSFIGGLVLLGFSQMLSTQQAILEATLTIQKKEAV